MPTLKDVVAQSSKLSEEERRRKMLLAMQDQIAPQYRHEINATPQSTETIQEPAGPDMSGYTQSEKLAEDSGVYGAGSQTEVSPLEGDTKGRFKDQVGRTFGPNDVEWTGNGYRVKSWTNRAQQAKQNYADTAPQLPARTRTVPTYTDANIKSEHIKGTGMDMTNPQDISKMSAYLASQGEKPESYGMPKLSDAVQLQGKMDKTKHDATHYFKSLDHIPAIMLQFGLPYNEGLSPMENWNSTIRQADPETKEKLKQAVRQGNERQSTGTQRDVKYIANLFNISEQEAYNKIKQTMHKPKEAYVAEAYKSAIAGYRTEVDAQKIAVDAGKFYDTLYGRPQTEEQIAPAIMHQSPANPQGQVTQEQAIAELKRRGKL
jgi:hypothetical protein